MREIKFRAWNYSKMIYNCAIRNGLVVNHKDSFYQIGQETNYPIMQYTGLKDKNGKEIYEGDIIKVFDNKNGVFKVEFKNQYVGGWLLCHEKGQVSLGARKKNDIEVVGNIYQNPELLK